jgi:hypothetical protein
MTCLDLKKIKIKNRIKLRRLLKVKYKKLHIITTHKISKIEAKVQGLLIKETIFSIIDRCIWLHKESRLKGDTKLKLLFPTSTFKHVMSNVRYPLFHPLMTL